MASAGGHGKLALSRRQAKLLIPVETSVSFYVTNKVPRPTEGCFLASWRTGSLSLAALLTSRSRKGPRFCTTLKAQDELLGFNSGVQTPACTAQPLPGWGFLLELLRRWEVKSPSTE